MVTIEFKSFQSMKSTIASSGYIDPNRFKPDKFHVLRSSGGSVSRIVCILSAGRIVLLYNPTQNENLRPNDSQHQEWFKDSVEVAAVGEQVT